MTATTPAHLFQPGNDPRRQLKRSTGSRNKLSTKFFNDLYGLWEEQGEACIRRAMFENPTVVMGIVAKLMPAKLEITTPTEGMTPERFEQLLDLAERMQALSAEKATASVTIEGVAVEVQEGRGSPHDGDARGEVIELVHYSAENPEPPLPLIAVGADRLPAAAPDPQATPTSLIAEVLITAEPEDGPDYVDPASLF